MIFIIPIILGAAALATAAWGVASGVDGISKMQEAEEIGKFAQKEYERNRKFVKRDLQATQNLAEEYGQLQIQIKLETIGRFVSFIESLGQRASQSDMQFLESLEGVAPQQISEYRAAALESERFAINGLTAVGAAYAAGQGTVALVGLFGTASTGAAISGLSGAAATNATLAWLGGGSLAAGGGGMALGSLVLGGITIGPALMIGGFVLAGQGEEALTEAQRYASKVFTEISKLDAFRSFLGQVQQQIIEFKSLVTELDDRASKELTELESAPFERERDAVKFQRVALLVKALAEIMKTPILDSTGNLNLATAAIKAKYRSI